MDLSQLPQANEIVVSAHEAAHAVASVRLGVPFKYVTIGDDDDGPRVESIENAPRPIIYYCGGGTCCGPDRPMCDTCRVEQDRAESWIVMAMCGSIGVAGTGSKLFGYGHEDDKVYVADFCRTAFADSKDEDVSARIKPLLKRALELMQPESKTVSAVARALRTRRTLTEDEVKDIMQNASE
jgi:hypothetical protein